MDNGSRFNFCGVSVKDFVKEIKKFSTWKATQSADLAVKILKDNSDIFENCICSFFNDCADKGNFWLILKHYNSL